MDGRHGGVLASPAVPVTRLHADEVDVDEGLVRALLADQLPRWADLPLRRTASSGTDNAIFRLGRDLVVRLPRIGWAVPQIAKELEWLPRLAPHLPVAVPEPMAGGAPGRGFPHPWLVSRWLPGDDALAGTVVDWSRLAEEVAAFVVALQQVATGGPRAGRRAGLLAPDDEATRRAILRLRGELDVERALAVWDAALAADPWGGPPVWVHGDLLPGNVIVREGELTGIIDWSAAGLGDPACDVMLAWSLPPAARAAYRAALGLDDATWSRARGWAVEQAVNFIPYYADTIPGGVAAARRRLDAVLADDLP